MLFNYSFRGLESQHKVFYDSHADIDHMFFTMKRIFQSTCTFEIKLTKIFVQYTTSGVPLTRSYILQPSLLIVSTNGDGFLLYKKNFQSLVNKKELTILLICTLLNGENPII